MKSNAVSIDPEVMHGAPVFRGTRVPVEALFDYLVSNSTVDEFISDFPTVKKSVINTFLDSLKKEYSFEEARAARRKHSAAIKETLEGMRDDNGSRNGLGKNKKRKAS